MLNNRVHFLSTSIILFQSLPTHGRLTGPRVTLKHAHVHLERKVHLCSLFPHCRSVVSTRNLHDNDLLADTNASKKNLLEITFSEQFLKITDNFLAVATEVIFRSILWLKMSHHKEMRHVLTSK